MNVKEYINSGIVESYVLGLATEAERQEFEQTCAAYPEVAEARDAFERLLEKELLAGAQAPPATVRAAVLNAVAATGGEEKFAEPEPAPVRRLNPWKWVAAASLLLLAGAGYWAYTASQKYNDLVARQQAVEKQLQDANTELSALRQDAETMRKPMRVVALKGTDKAPQAQTTVYWDTTGTRDVYMVVNNLPQPASEKQYQLWALLNGQPIDLGVFDYDVQQKRLLLRMKNVQNAQAFAITLEQKGGSPTPRGDIYVMANL